MNLLAGGVAGVNLAARVGCALDAGQWVQGEGHLRKHIEDVAVLGHLDDRPHDPVPQERHSFIAPPPL